MAFNLEKWAQARNTRLSQKTTTTPVLQSELTETQKPQKSWAGFKAGLASELKPQVEKAKQSIAEIGTPAETAKYADRRNLAVETVKGLPKAALTEVVQPTMRGYAGLQSFATGGKGALTPTGKGQELAYGTDKPITAESVGRELVGEKAPKPLAVGIGAAIGVADLFGGSGTRAKTLIKGIAKAKDSKTVVGLLDELVPGLKNISDRKALETALVLEKDPNKVKQIIDFAVTKNDKRPPKFTVEKPPTPKLDEEVVYFVRTGGDLQYVARDPELVKKFSRNDGSDIEVGVVKRGSVTPTGQEVKDQAGIGTIKRTEAESLYETNRINPPAKERSYTTGSKSMFPDEASNKFEGEYFTRSTAELSAKVNKMLDQNPEEAMRIVDEGTDDVAVATASEYLNRLAKQANEATDIPTKNALYEKAAEISNSMAAKLTELGRSIQAASILSRQTPEGQLRAFSKSIQDFNKTAPPNRRIPNLTGEEAQAISERARKIQAMPDGEAKAIEWSKFQRDLSRRIPTPMLKKIQTLWKAGLLTGLKTTGLNLLSNVSHFALEGAKQYPASLADALMSIVTGKRTLTAGNKGVMAGIKEGTFKGKRYFFTGFDERNIGEKLDYNAVNFKSPIVQKYVDIVFGALGSTDQPFYYGAYARSMMDQALAAGKNKGLKGKELVKFAEDLVKTPTEDMAKYAAIDATTVVFQNKTTLGKIAKGVQNLPGVGQFIVPFAQTPSAVATQILNYTPIGTVAEAVKQIKRGKFDQRILAQAIGRSTVGTIPLYLGYKLSEAGLVKLDYPKGDERSIELDKAEGVAYNSIKVGNSWVNPNTLGPAGPLLLMGAHFQDTIAKAGSPTQAISDAFLGAAESLTEQTFFTGIKSFVDALGDIKGAGPAYVGNLVASFVPTIVSDVARATDPLERNASASVVSRTMARIPGAREALPPQINILGQEIQRKSGPVATMINPLRPSKDVSTPVTNELRRLMNAGYKASPTKLGDKSGYGSLSGTQNNRMWQIAGGVTNTKLTELFSNQGYQQLPDEKKTEVIEKTVRLANNLARAQVLAELTAGKSIEEASPIIKKHIESGLINETIFKLYTQIR